MGAAWPGASRISLPAPPGLLWAGRLWTRAAEAFAGAWSNPFDTYHEAMIGIPNVRLAGRHGGPFMLVLAMYTDSPIAKWGDEVLRCGYEKRLARFSRAGFVDYGVANGDGEALFRMRTDARASDGWESAAALDEIEGFTARLEQPLLGYLGEGEYAVSMLERSYDPPVLARRVSVQIVTDRGGDAVLPGRRELRAQKRPGYGAMQFEGMPVRLTYPEHLKP